MQFGGPLPVDAPDPAEGLRMQALGLGIPVAGLVAQRHLEDLGVTGMSSEHSGLGEAPTTRATVSRSYLVWRNPDDRSDPANLRELDEATRRALEQKPPWPRPAWILRRAEQLRHPMLGDAVHTNWTAPDSEPWTVVDDLVQHVNYILNNHFRDEYGSQDASRWNVVVDARHVQKGYDVVIDGEARSGIVIDTNPHVLGVGVEFEAHRTMTAVVPRDELASLRLEFDSDVPL